MASVRVLGCCQNYLFPTVLNRVPVVVFSRFASKDISKNILKKLNLPDPPKRPGTGFAKFVQIQTPLLRKQYPDCVQSDILKLAGSLWKDTEDAVKAKLKEEANAEMVAYKKQLEYYKETILKPKEAEILKEKKNAEKRKERRELIKQGKPKRPASAFARFVASQQDSRGELGVAEFMKLLGKKWKELPLTEKAKYELEFTLCKAKYQTDINIWASQQNQTLLTKLIIPPTPRKTDGSKKKKKEEQKENKEQK